MFSWRGWEWREGGLRDHKSAKVGLYVVKSLSSVAWGRDTSEHATPVTRAMVGKGLAQVGEHRGAAWEGGDRGKASLELTASFVSLRLRTHGGRLCGGQVGGLLP